MATLYWAAGIAFFTIQIRSVLVNNIGMELSEKFALVNVATTKPAVIQIVLFPFMVL
jgi:hypothetical protein